MPNPSFIPPIPIHHTFHRNPLRHQTVTRISRRPRFTSQIPTPTTQLLPKKGEPDRDDPLQLETPFPHTTAPKISPRIARTSLQALIAYYKSLCTTDPSIARRLTLAILSIVLSKIIGISVPLLLKRTIDLLLHPAPTPTLRPVLAAILAYTTARTLASITHELRSAIFAKAGQRIGRSITATTFEHIHSLETAFHNASRTGAITRVIDRGTRSVLVIFRGMVFNFLPSMFELALVCTVLIRSFSPLYVLVTVLTFIAFIAWTLVINDELGAVRAQLNEAENDASAKLTDSLLNVEAVKSFDNCQFETTRYDESLARYENVAVRNEWIYARLNMGQGLIYTLGLTINLILAAAGVVAGRLTVGSVVLLSTMLQQLWVPLNFLGWQYREVKQSLIDLQNLFDIIRRESKVLDAPGAMELLVGGGEIVFENVSFKYPEADEEPMEFARKSSSVSNAGASDEFAPKLPERKLAIDGLSFRVPAGTSLALVGPSGSGKSTATRLLYRLYDLSGGRILIDGQDISKTTISSLRKALSIVPQDTVLFNDTIAYNIRYGRPSATDEEVIAAAKAASIHDVIMRTPQGYQTAVGERGVRLSGGERQRLSVARAFLKGSKIILEDESTSALDTLTEMEVSKALEKLGVDRTRIIVAHRLSTILDVDHIVVMDMGKKVEEGSFSELLKIRNGVFKGMWERQQKKDEEQDVLLLGRDDGRITNAFDTDGNASGIGPGVGGVILDGASPS